MFQSLFISMDKNKIKDAYLKLINSDIVKNIYPMLDHIDIVEFNKIPFFQGYDLYINIFVDDIDMTEKNMYQFNFDPHWLAEHHLQKISKYLGIVIRSIRFKVYDNYGRSITSWDN